MPLWNAKLIQAITLPFYPEPVLTALRTEVRLSPRPSIIRHIDLFFEVGASEEAGGVCKDA
jgi:hypothetical protein